MTDLDVEVRGEGETAALVHGSGFRDSTWADQKSLAERYRLVMPFRRGYGKSPEADPDFEVDAEDIAALLEEPSHLVGYSYGGVACLVAAAKRPDAVRSLTVIEPPAFGIARGDPRVEELMERIEPVYARAREMTVEEFDHEFDTALGFQPRHDLMDETSRAIVDSVRRERPPWEAEISFERLEEVPVLVVSGGWSPAFDAVCDVLEERLGAERAVLPGAGHGAQHAAGFNERLVAFWELAG